MVMWLWLCGSCYTSIPTRDTNRDDKIKFYSELDGVLTSEKCATLGDFIACVEFREHNDNQ